MSCLLALCSLCLSIPALPPHCELTGWHLIMCVHQAEPLCWGALTHTLARSTALLTNSLSADRHSAILESRPSQLTQTWLGLKLQQSKLNTHNCPLTKHLLNKHNSHLSWLKHYSFASVFRIRFIFTHLADTFIQCDLHRIQGTQFLISLCIPWESNP